MNILIIEDEAEARSLVQTIVERKFAAPGTNVTVVHCENLQAGIELLEKQDQLFDLIVFEYGGTGQALVKCLLQFGGQTAYVMSAPDATSRASFMQPGLLLEVAIRSDMTKTLPAALAALETQRSFGDTGTPDTDFVQLKAQTLIGVSPIKCDLYIRLSANRYVKLIRKGEELDQADMKKLRDIKRAESFYIRKNEADSLLDRQTDNLHKLVNSPTLTEDEADHAAEASIDAMRDIVERVGFTPKAQALAKMSVEITLKLLGARPKLSAVLSRLKQEEGKYISAHSVTLGKIACALAYKVQWNSAATYLKLTLAAFLHDLPLSDNALAACATLEDTKKPGKFSNADQLLFKLHPIKAAEYARQFNEIPADVDQILMQHHELPDGTGFPRNLTHKYISPLASLFIIAHDLLHFMATRPTDTSMDEFFAISEAKYNTGHFKKLLKQLREDTSAP